MGEVDRELSKKAYTFLSRIEKEDADFDTSYSILSDGHSLAVAFDESALGDGVAKRAAVNALKEEILKGKTNMNFSSGVLKRETK